MKDWSITFIIWVRGIWIFASSAPPRQNMRQATFLLSSQHFGLWGSIKWCRHVEWRMNGVTCLFIISSQILTKNYNVQEVQVCVGCIACVWMLHMHPCGVRFGGWDTVEVVELLTPFVPIYIRDMMMCEFTLSNTSSLNELTMILLVLKKPHGWD